MADSYGHVIDGRLRDVLLGESSSWGAVQHAVRLTLREATRMIDDFKQPDALVYARAEQADAIHAYAGNGEPDCMAHALRMLRQFWRS